MDENNIWDSIEGSCGGQGIQAFFLSDTALLFLSLRYSDTHTHTNQGQDPDVKWPKNCKVIKQLDQ